MLLRGLLLIGISTLAGIPPALAEWSVTADGYLYYTEKPQGFVYAVNPEWSQASIAAEILHSFTPNTALRLRYYTGWINS